MKKPKKDFNTIKVEDYPARVLMHDLTKVDPGDFRGTAFKKDHVIKESDILLLKDTGKECVYAFNIPKNYQWSTRRGILNNVLKNLKRLKEKNIKLNTIFINAFNTSEPEDIINFAHDRGFMPRFIEKKGFTDDALQAALLNTLQKRFIYRGIIKKFPGRNITSGRVRMSSAAG